MCEIIGDENITDECSKRTLEHGNSKLLYLQHGRMEVSFTALIGIAHSNGVTPYAYF